MMLVIVQFIRSRAQRLSSASRYCLTGQYSASQPLTTSHVTVRRVRAIFIRRSSNNRCVSQVTSQLAEAAATWAGRDNVLQEDGQHLTKVELRWRRGEYEQSCTTTITTIGTKRRQFRSHETTRPSTRQLQLCRRRSVRTFCNDNRTIACRVFNARFPPFRCRSSVAVSPFCRCKIPLFCKNYVNGKKLP